MTGIAAERFLSAMQSHGFTVRPSGTDRWRGQCPAHNGTDLNLAFAVGDQGLIVRCHSYDCPAEDIARAIGLSLGDLFDKGGQAVYDYGDGHTVHRYRTREGKRIVQEGHPHSVTNLYRHPDSLPIEQAEVVTLVEGEKSVDAALRLGLECVTTWPGGVGGVAKVDINPLHGKRIHLIADNDTPGLQAMAIMANRLSAVATVDSVRMAPTEKQGVDDLWLDGGSLDDLVPVDLAAQIAKARQTRREREAVIRTFDKVSTRRARFLWDGLIPQGALTTFGGRGGTGKSSFALYLAGRVTRGDLPGVLKGTPSTVLYVSHEDSAETVIGPRLDANGVERARFAQLGIRAQGGEVTIPALPEDLPLIRQAIIDTNAKVVIIDPMTSTMGGDNDRLADVRRVLDPLNALAQELDIVIIAIAHFRKGVGNQSDLISGSHAWRDASRCVIVFAQEKETEDADEQPVTVMTVDKSNNGRSGNSYQFRLDVIEVPLDDGDTGPTTKVLWMGESRVSVGQIVNSDGRRSEFTTQVKAFVDQQPGAVRTADVIAAFPDDTPDKVKKALYRLGDKGLIHKPAFGLWQPRRFAPDA